MTVDRSRTWRANPRLAVALAVVACKKHDDVRTFDAPGYNVLLMLSDDAGTDKTSVYGGTVPTPTIDALAEGGLRFDNAYAHPTCSPSRAALLTGRLPGRTGIGRWINVFSEDTVLALDEITIPEMLSYSEHAYTSALVGKWHLAGFDQTAIDPTTHALQQGFATHRGPLANPRDYYLDNDGGDLTYTHWQKNTDGVLSYESDYLTTVTVDDAIAQIQELPEPWFLYVAFNAAHEPWHAPPDHLHDRELGDSPSQEHETDAMVQALDTEMGRLIAALDEDLRARTVIVYAADNGTTGASMATGFDADRGKGTVYDLGVRVPFVVNGPIVANPGTRSDALVHVVDVFPTVAAIAGVDATTLANGKLELDGLSLVPLLEGDDGGRDHVYTEHFKPNGLRRDPDDEDAQEYRMVRTATHKYMRVWRNGRWSEQFFRYGTSTVDEGYDLLSTTGLSDDEQAILDDLSALMDAQIDAMPVRVQKFD